MMQKVDADLAAATKVIDDSKLAYDDCQTQLLLLKNEQKELLARIAGAPIRESSACSICLDQKKSHILIPCGHKCVKCASSLTRKPCPLCRVVVQSTMQVFD